MGENLNSVRSHEFPSPLSERAIIDVSGGGYFLTFNKDWIDQWGLSVGESIIIWVNSDSNKIYVEPYESKKYSELEEESELVWKKELKPFGNSQGIFIKTKELEEDLGMERVGTILQTSNHTMVIEPYSRERAEELQEKWREFIMEE